MIGYFFPEQATVTFSAAGYKLRDISGMFTPGKYFYGNENERKKEKLGISSEFADYLLWSPGSEWGMAGQPQEGK